MVSPRFGSSITTGRLTTVPVPRIATCGWLMIGVSKRAPTLPVLVSVNVPPDSSSGPILLVRVRSATSAILRASPAIVEVARVLDDRGQQPPLGVHRDREVLARRSR